MVVIWQESAQREKSNVTDWTQILTKDRYRSFTKVSDLYDKMHGAFLKFY